MDKDERDDFVRDLSSKAGKRSRVLRNYKVPRSTYYHWRKKASGKDQLPRRNRVVWNGLSDPEREIVMQVARNNPDKSAREIAALISDEQNFNVSESTVYRMLKDAGLIRERTPEERPAEKVYRWPTSRPNEMWQSDATMFFVVGWGYYKLIIVMDDFSRYVLAWELGLDETSQSISDVVQKAIEATGADKMPADQKPKLLSDNGPGYAGVVLSNYLATHGIRHIFGAPYHPQTQGKVERLNRTLKERLCLIVYLTPDDLRKAIAEAVDWHNNRYHKSLRNVSPKAVYEGRRDEILRMRAEKKVRTMKERMAYNRIKRARLNGELPQTTETANSDSENVSKNC